MAACSKARAWTSIHRSQRSTCGPSRAPQCRLADLKALFFVRSLDGDAAHDESRVPDPSDPRSRGATIIKLGFADGETIVGSTIRYPPNRPFFYVVPVDAKSNNIRILINKDAVISMEQVSGS